MAILKVQNLHKSYSTLHVLKGVDFQVAKGEIVSIVGASGAGKSTLLHILSALDYADKGQVWLNGQDLSTLGTKQLAKVRNAQMGFVFQFHHLLPEFTALENVCMPAYLGKKSRKLAQQKAMELLDLLHVSDRKHHKPSQLSGGEQQRVAVARALINEPAIVFADEPSGNLDSTNAAELHALFFQLRASLKQTFIIVTHNDELAQQTGRRLLMKDGRFVDEEVK